MDEKILEEFLKNPSGQTERLLSPEDLGNGIRSLDDPFVIHHQDYWWVFFTASDGVTDRIGWAVSRDGTRWQTPTIGPMGANPWILRHNDWDEPIPKMRRGLFWLTSITPGHEEDGGGAIHLAFSEDLISWQPFTPPIVLEPSPEEEWEGKGLQAPVLLEKDGFFWLFYEATNFSSSVGLAQSRDLVQWSRSISNPLVRLPEPSRRFFLSRIEKRWWLLADQPSGWVAAVSDDLSEWEITRLCRQTRDFRSPYLIADMKGISLFYSSEEQGSRSLFRLRLQVGG